MKTHQIKDLLKKEILIIELPQGATMLPPEIINGNTYISYSPALFAPPTNLELLANGKWKILGKPDEIKEEDARKLVHQSIFMGGLFAHHVSGVNPPNVFCYKTALESFNSALESEIYWVNPFGTRESNTLIEGGHEMWAYSDEHFITWNEAQEKTFDRSRTLIFAKQ